MNRISFTITIIKAVKNLEGEILYVHWHIQESQFIRFRFNPLHIFSDGLSTFAWVVQLTFELCDTSSWGLCMGISKNFCCRFSNAIGVNVQVYTISNIMISI